MLLFILLIWLICGIVGYQLGKERSVGEGGGLVIGLFLGVIGVIVLLCLPKVDKEWQNTYDHDRQIADSYNRQGVEKSNRPGAADEIKKWYELKEAGAITAEEFEAKKKALLK